MTLTDHKTVGLQYGVTAAAFLLVGFLLMLLFRWQLAWPGQPLPSMVAAALGEANTPGGFMLPEFYNQLVAMHGTVMIFLAVVPMLTGAFGNYLVPLQIGASDMVFPRLNAASYWTYLAAGLLMVSGFFVSGGAANSGWTSYPPLSVIATRGQDFWLGGMFLLSVSSMLNSVTMIATIVQARAPGLTFMRLPFFVWAQLVAALLLLMAFPALQAAVTLQLMDRLAGTSFFLPSGLMVGGVPLEWAGGGGNPLLWQHLFWFLAHPEVYVLILPAMGIVAEILANNARRPLWGYRIMVGSVLFLGVMSVIVWAHHMFLTGMGTTLSGFFQVTTMVISVPSVVLITALVLTLWGGSIRFTVPMLFALAFLPMFGIGGLTGLPLGLAAADISLHDTYYVVGHFHYLVAPGTLFAIFAGVYYWFPKITGRRMSAWLGHVHFWGSFLAMNNIFLPMFAMGLMGVNRRLFDAGQQYLHAEPTLNWNVHMTMNAVLLGLCQIPFLVNLHWSMRRGAPAGDNPWDATTLEWSAASPPPHGNFASERRVVRGAYEYSVPGEATDFSPQHAPEALRAKAEDQPLRIQPVSDSTAHTHTPRPDTGVTSARLGMYLFLASDGMLTASLLSAYVLLRAGAPGGPDLPTNVPLRWSIELALLLATTFSLYRASVADRPHARRALLMAGIATLSFAAWKAAELVNLLTSGGSPLYHVMTASWLTLANAHAVHVLGATAAIAWLYRHAAHDPAERLAGRLAGARLYWHFTLLCWVVLVLTLVVTS
jgi:cytochrome c oxidase subunit I